MSDVICCSSAAILKDAGLEVGRWQTLIWYCCPVTSQWSVGCQRRMSRVAQGLMPHLLTWGEKMRKEEKEKVFWGAESTQRASE